MKPVRTFALALLLCSSLAHARPPEGEAVDPSTSDWYRGLRAPGTSISCCSIADCRPTEFRPSPTQPTLWQAFISKTLYGSTAPDAWVDVPADKILQNRDNPTGRMVVCWLGGAIRCAVLPSLT